MKIKKVMNRNCIARAAAVALLALGGAVSAAAAAKEELPEQQVRVFSHRGGRMEHDENTLPAFEASWRGGYTGFETDVRVTRDGELIITHDSKLERTTNGTGAVEEKTLAELQGLRTKQGNHMLTLDELLAFLKGKKGLYVEFEMKTTPASLYPDSVLERYVDKLYAKVSAAQPVDALFLFTSSDERALRLMQQRHPDAQLLFITSKPVCRETIERCVALGIPRIGAKMEGTSREAVALAHKQGLTVSLWPGKSVADFMLGVFLGADYLCTDVPLAQKRWQQRNARYLNVKY